MRFIAPMRVTGYVVDHRLVIVATFGTFVSAASIWVLASTFDASALRETLGRANLSLLVAGIGTLALSMVVRTARWQAILPVTASGRRPTVQKLLPLVLVGYAINSIAPMRLGDVVRGLVASRRFRTGGPEALGSVSLERILDAGALAAVAALASIGAAVPIWLTQGTLLIAAAATTIVVSVYLVGMAARRQPAAGRNGQISILWRAWVGLRANPRAIATSSALSATAWCIDGVTVWIIARSLGVEIGWEIAMLIATGAALGAILPSAPAAIGTFHLAGTAVGVAMGLDGSTALAIVVLWHTATVVPLIIAGAVSASLVGIRVRDLRFATRRGSNLSSASRRVLSEVQP